ncbi:DUF983 domain-containing protein [Hymenobacter yonginensis]|uniref:DUF983 domain-containing protein n=1 Tax=Hymenobacter yonginensis TaxID=748197 RepID=A0ABY7PI90_9BACT|nr:DUF983 domain-containing protein [Hymenobacter yonginensis]WBO83090.1 DUF983 domain-containing protein [Hymenobacter yonginensis]
MAPRADSTVAAMLAQKCPRCHRGPLFRYSALHLTRFDDMYESCAVCGQHYEPEVGFYWGAMYISYGFSTLIVVLTGVLLFYLAHDPPVWVYVTAVAVVVVALTPLLFRYARVVMLYFFGGIHYTPRFAESLPLRPAE